MKKIKLFALAAFAMLSTNAFAAPTWDATVKSTETFTYVVEKDGGSETGNAKITGFVNGLTAAQMQTLTIPATIDGEGDDVYNVTAIETADGTSTATKFAGNTSIKKIVIAANSNLTTIATKTFEGCSGLTEIDLSNADQLTTIGASAFAGTALVTLDLSKTKVADMSTFEFCDKTAAAATGWSKNNTLTTVILWDQWTSIGGDAFKNCKALKSVNFQTANSVWLNYVTTATQAIAAGAFVNTAIEDLDLSGTILTTLAAKTFNTLNTDDLSTDAKFAAATIAENKALKTVKLNGSIAVNKVKKGIASLAANFSNCPNLTSIDKENDAALVGLVDNEFQYDAKLTGFNLANITTLGASAFEGTGLTEVVIPNTIDAIPASCFQDCAALATVTFMHTTQAFTGIATMAFAGDTKLAAITIPASMTQADNAIAVNAFFMCTGLTSVTYKPNAVDATKGIFNVDAFKQCNDGNEANLLTIYTITGMTTKTTASVVTTAPACAKWSTDTPSGTLNTLDWTVTKYVNADKYYVKVYVPGALNDGIKVKAVAGTKVYSAYIDQAADAVDPSDPLTLHMCEYKIIGGYYWIPADDAALIITDNKDLTYAKSGDKTKTSSWTTVRTALNKGNAYVNQLIYADAAISATTIAAGADNGKVIYGWANSATKGTGWLNVTSGTIKKGSLYVLAKKPADGARLNVVWEDADGNIEAETTAIQSIETKAEAEDGAIYNLAGQKVNAAYKGVVIKNGKKFIQK